MANSADPNANHDVEVISIAVIFSLFSLVTVVARFVSKRLNSVGFTVDDHLLTTSWIIATAEAGMIAGATQFGGGGRHVQTLTPEQLIGFQKAFYIASILQPTTLTLSKISILILLHRIFVTRKFRITVYVLGGVVCAWWVAATFGGAFICSPIKKVWDPSVPGTCGDQKLLIAVSPIPWVLTDFAILICPLPVIKHLHLPAGKKIAVTAMMMIGAITCIVCVLRYRSIFYPIEDITWDVIPLADWNIVEAHVTIVCAALIACKPILSAMIPTRVSSAVEKHLMAAGSWLSSNTSRRRRGTNSGNTPTWNGNGSWNQPMQGDSETKLRPVESV